MIKFNNNNINGWDYNASELIKVYYNHAVAYHKIYRTTYKAVLTLSNNTTVNIVDDGTGVLNQAELSAYTGTCVSATILDTVTEVGYRAFYDFSAMTNVTIANTVTELGQDAFLDCIGLTEITCNATTAPTIYNTTFKGVANGGTLYYPEGSDYSTWLSSSSYYLGYYSWSDGNEISFVLEGMCDIGTEVFNVLIDGVNVSTVKKSDGEWGLAYDGTPTNIAGMFSGLTNVTTIMMPTEGSFNTSNVTDMSYAFCGCTNLSSVDVSYFDTSNVTTMSHMFDGCSALYDITVNDMSNVTDASYMFHDCSMMYSIFVQNTENVVNMEHMFDGCSSVDYLSSSINPYNATNLNYMYANCSAMTDGYPQFPNNGENRYSIDGMFSGCSSIAELYLDSIQRDFVSSSTNLLAGCDGLTTIYCSSYDFEWVQEKVAEAGLSQTIEYYVDGEPYSG